MQGEITLGDEIGQALHNLCAQNDDIKLFLEIGTGSGNGSTVCIIDGMSECQGRNFRQGVKLISIEYSPEHHKQAKEFLKDKKSLIEVELLLGATLTADDIPPLEFFTQIPMIYEEQARDWYPATQRLQQGRNNILRELISRYKTFDAVLIDGGGFWGRAEFQILKDRCKYFILDDTNSKYSYKNHHNRQEILENPQKWTVLCDNINYRHGWMIAVNSSFSRANDNTEQQLPTTKADIVRRIFDELDAGQVNFVTLRGFDLIPHQVSQKQDVDLIIHPNSIESASRIFESHGFTAQPIDPKDTVYMYGTHPSIFFVNKQLDIAFHVVKELAYKSIHRCEMVPLDEELQVSIFKNKRRVDEIWKYMPSHEDEFLMLLCRCIYDKRTVPGNYKNRIEELLRTTDTNKIQECCHPVFLKSTPMLLSTIAEDQTDSIFERYITFSNY